MSSPLEELAKAWAASQSVEGERTEAEWEPIFAVHALVAEPEQLWEFIVTAEPICTTDSSFSMLGTGPLEDLIQEYGPQFVDRIEQRATENPRFAQLFQHVWVESDQDPVTMRFVALGCDQIRPSA